MDGQRTQRESYLQHNSQQAKQVNSIEAKLREQKNPEETDSIAETA